MAVSIGDHWLRVSLSGSVTGRVARMLASVAALGMTVWYGMVDASACHEQALDRGLPGDHKAQCHLCKMPQWKTLTATNQLVLTPCQGASYLLRPLCTMWKVLNSLMHKCCARPATLLG